MDGNRFSLGSLPKLKRQERRCTLSPWGGFTCLCACPGSGSLDWARCHLGMRSPMWRCVYWTWVSLVPASAWRAEQGKGRKEDFIGLQQPGASLSRQEQAVSCLGGLNAQESLLMPQQTQSWVPAQDSQLVLKCLSAQIFHYPHYLPLPYPCFYLPLLLNILWLIFFWPRCRRTLAPVPVGNATFFMYLLYA